MVYVWPVTGLSAWTVTVLGVGVCPAIERWIASATLDANAQLVDGDQADQRVGQSISATDSPGPNLLRRVHWWVIGRLLPGSPPRYPGNGETPRPPSKTGTPGGLR